MVVCFHKGGLGHTAGILECHILKPFHKCFNGISFLLSHRQESWYNNLQVIFNEVGEESFSRSLQFLIEPTGSFMNHSKAIPFRVSMNKCARMTSFDTTPCLRLEVVYVLLR